MYSFKKDFRTECILCGNSCLSNLLKLDNMPVFMGVNKGHDEFFSDMNFMCCSECKTIQIKEIIDPNLLYINNHNLPIVGKIWENHYNEFILFLKNEIIDLNILEIGDPSYKLSKYLSDKSNIWYIVEINPNENINPPKNTFVIKSFFDDNLNIEDKIDVVIHSHFLEHVTDIRYHINSVYNLLSDDGKLLFSVPNLESILVNESSPNNVLHFEHTYFFTKKSIIHILENQGFKFIESKDYKNHSIFFHFQKEKKINTTFVPEDYSEFFIKNFDKFKKKVIYINTILNSTDKKVFLYGAHVSSQFLLNIGLKSEKILYILDNSIDKQEYCLYGTNIFVKPITILSEHIDSIVIVSHMGIYFEEIKEQILKINPNLIVL
jgi:predicted SAM-dependent methyltransferase